MPMPPGFPLPWCEALDVAYLDLNLYLCGAEPKWREWQRGKSMKDIIPRIDERIASGDLRRRQPEPEAPVYEVPTMPPDDGVMHEDLKLALGFRIRGEVMAMLADAFIERHKQEGWTLEHLAKRIGISRDEVIAFMQQPEDPKTHPDDLTLAELAAIFEAMGGRMVLKMVDLASMQPPWLQDGDGI